MEALEWGTSPSVLEVEARYQGPLPGGGVRQWAPREDGAPLHSRFLGQHAAGGPHVSTRDAHGHIGPGDARNGLSAYLRKGGKLDRAMQKDMEEKFDERDAELESVRPDEDDEEENVCPADKVAYWDCRSLPCKVTCK